MGMEDFQYLLSDLATAFRQDALWSTLDAQGRMYQPVATIPGRFRIDPVEVPLGGHEPGLGETSIWFYCDRAIVPKPWPVLGDLLTINAQIYEIVQRDEDDIGEFGFRLIRQEIGISTVTSEGAIDGQVIINPLATGPPTVPPLIASALAIPAKPNGNYANPMQPPKAQQPNGRPSRRAEIVSAFESAVAAGAIDPQRPLKELCAVMHHRLGNGGGLSTRTLRRVVGGLVRSHRVGT